MKIIHILLCINLLLYLQIIEQYLCTGLLFRNSLVPMFSNIVQIVTKSQTLRQQEIKWRPSLRICKNLHHICQLKKQIPSFRSIHIYNIVELWHILPLRSKNRVQIRIISQRMRAKIRLSKPLGDPIWLNINHGNFVGNSLNRIIELWNHNRFKEGFCGV